MSNIKFLSTEMMWTYFSEFLCGPQVRRSVGGWTCPKPAEQLVNYNSVTHGKTCVIIACMQGLRYPGILHKYCQYTNMLLKTQKM